jgi:hypothetical protein
VARAETMGSQQLLRLAVNSRPQLLQASLRRSGAVGRREQLDWVSPLSGDKHREYRDNKALAKLQVTNRLSTPLSSFWPARGPVWDALGVAGASRPVLVEAKAHIPEMVGSGTRATPVSLATIERSLHTSRRYLAPRSKAPWTGTFYQYANRLAYQYYLRRLNRIESGLVFLCFTHAVDMDGPTSEAEWRGAIRLAHAALGLPPDLSRFGVFHAFLDARHLADAA